MLTITLFLCGITLITSAPTESTDISPNMETGACELIQENANIFLVIETVFGCCEEPDCEQVENEDCKIAVQEKLQPCLLNSNTSCASEALFLEPQITTDYCPDNSNICQALRDSRHSLLDTMDIMCPITDPEDRFIGKLLGKLLGGGGGRPGAGGKRALLKRLLGKFLG